MRWIFRFSEHTKDLMVIVVVALACALAATCLVATLLIVSEHNADIQRIDVVSQEVRTAQLEQNQDLRTIAAYARQIDAYGAQLEANQGAICAATPGCKLP